MAQNVSAPDVSPSQRSKNRHIEHVKPLVEPKGHEEAPRFTEEE